MTTMTGQSRTVTRSVESDASVSAVLTVLTDPTRIPEWAPAFADRVADDHGSGWLATKDAMNFAMRLAVNHDAGTVDYLREVAPGREGGAYIRTFPRPGNGSVIVMTLPLLPDVDPTDTAATLNQEMSTLLALVQHWPGPGHRPE